jgi:phenylacetate-coenzyme A ligase PaaK-like adenylate-forming protein
VAAIPPGAEWRIVVTREIAGLDVLTVVVEAGGTDVAALADDLHHRLHVRPVVEPVPAGSLERFEGKARRVIDRRAED